MNVRFVFVFVAAIALFATALVVLNALSVQASLEASMDPLPRSGKVTMHDIATNPKAPMVASGDNLYIVWWSNKTGNDEVMFKASTDAGKTFGDKMNLSNTTNTQSQDAQIAAAGNNVYVTWWERNQTSNEPLLRVSNNNGKSFGEIIKLSSNTTTGSDGR